MNCPIMHTASAPARCRQRRRQIRRQPRQLHPHPGCCDTSSPSRALDPSPAQSRQASLPTHAARQHSARTPNPARRAACAIASAPSALASTISRRRSADPVRHRSMRECREIHLCGSPDRQKIERGARRAVRRIQLEHSRRNRSRRGGRLSVHRRRSHQPRQHATPRGCRPRSSRPARGADHRIGQAQCANTGREPRVHVATTIAVVREKVNHLHRSHRMI